MKKYNIITALLFSLLIGMTSCGKNFDVSDKYDGVLSLSSPGYTLVQTYDVGQEHTENIYFQRGGLDFTPSTINISIDENLIDSINSASGTSYKLMPDDQYKLDKTLTVDNEERLIVGKVTVNPASLRELNSNQYGASDYVIPIRITADGMSVIENRNTLILRFNVNEATIKVSNMNDENIDIESTDIMKFSINCPFENQWDIKVKSEVDEGYVDVYNEQNGTFYSLLPQECYTTEGEVIIQKGINNADLEFSLNKDKIRPGNYILPVKISSVETDVNMSFDKNARKVFIITKGGEYLDRTSWTIAYVSSQETVGDPGQAEHLIDEDVNSFWHSVWKPTNDPLPYDIVIDCKKLITPSQMEMLVRNNNGNLIRMVRFYIADNISSEKEITESDWEFIGEFSCNVSTNYFTYPVKSSTGRYIRFNVPDAGGNGTVAAVCDLKIRGSVQ